MFEYIKYYLAVIVVGIAYVGFALGGDWVWLGLGTFPALALIDTLLPRDLSQRKMRNAFWAAVPVWIACLAPVFLYALAAWQVAHGHLLPSQILGMFLTLVWSSVMPCAPAGHELYHMRNNWARFFGRYSQLCILDCMRDIGHVVSHHLDVCTAKDPDTAPRGTNLYAFAGKEVFVSFMLECQTESAGLERRGFGRWNIRHRIWRAVLAQVIFQTGIYLIGGWPAVVFTLGAMFGGRFFLETFNYLQHYGLVRAEGAPIGRRHVWNHLGTLSRLIGFELTNHADHHMNSYQPYYELVPHEDGIVLPNMFICYFAALIPPVWEAYIAKPALRKWDLEYATAEERKLAAAQNRSAGWPDWQSDPGAQPGTARTVGV